MSFFQIVPHEIAEQRGMKFYFTGSTCARGNEWLRRVSTRNCVCPDCISIKNAGNKRHYESIKDDPEFKARVKETTESKKEWKREYDKWYRENNREKQNEWSRNWVKKNPEKRKSISLNCAHKRRAVVKSGMGNREFSEWIDRQKKVCYWCGSSCKRKFHIDHYVPLSRGGRHEQHNLVIACPRCNLTKNAKDPYEFANNLGRLF